MALPECTDEELQALYEWVDSVPLSRPKKSIARDFADGVLLAEMVHHYFPKLVELHNYSAAHNSVQKMYNWNTLNQKVFKRMGFSLAREHYEAVVNCEAGSVERVLKAVRTRMARFQETGGRVSRQGSGAAAAGHDPAASSSQPGSPACYGGRSGTAAAAAASDAIAAIRIAAQVPGKMPASSAAGSAAPVFPTLDQALASTLGDKEQQLEELRETNELLETKISKLEQLVRLKDAKIQALLAKLQAGPAAGDGTPGAAEQRQQQRQMGGVSPAAGVPCF